MRATVWMTALAILASISTREAKGQASGLPSEPEPDLRVNRAFLDEDSRILEITGEDFDSKPGRLDVWLGRAYTFQGAEAVEFVDITSQCVVDVSGRPHRIRCALGPWPERLRGVRLKRGRRVYTLPIDSQEPAGPRPPEVGSGRPFRGLRISDAYVDFDAQTIEVVGEDFNFEPETLTVSLFPIDGDLEQTDLKLVLDISTHCRIVSRTRIRCDFSAGGLPPAACKNRLVLSHAGHDYASEICLYDHRTETFFSRPAVRRDFWMTDSPSTLSAAEAEQRYRKWKEDALYRELMWKVGYRPCAEVLRGGSPDPVGQLRRDGESAPNAAPPDPIPPYTPCPCDVPAVIREEDWPRGAQVRVACTSSCTVAGVVTADAAEPYLEITKRFYDGCYAATRHRWFAKAPRLDEEEFSACSHSVIDYLRTLRDSRLDLVFAGDDLDSCQATR